MPTLKLAGKTAVITGGARGIGAAITRLFATAGAQVHIVDLHGENAKRVAGEVGGVAHVCDVSDEAAAAKVFAAISKIDILVNSVGVANVGKLDNTTPEVFDHLFRNNVRSYYIAMRAAVEKMKQQGGGVIVNLASIAASCGLADRFAYSMTKGAVLAMTYSVARDYLSSNIRCNAISPARVHTPFVDGFIRENYPGKEIEAFQRLSAAQPIGRMAGRRKLRRWRCFCVRRKLRSSPASIIRLTAVFSTCTDENRRAPALLAL